MSAQYISRSVWNWLGVGGRDRLPCVNEEDDQKVELTPLAPPLSQSLARLGASTLGIDATPSNIPLAQSHALLDPFFATPLTPHPSNPSLASFPRLEYRHQTAEALLAQEGEGKFDVVCAMEVLEHVDDPAGFLKDLTKLVKVRFASFPYTAG